MCDRIVVLARLDHRRWISCCEHGTTHLAWDTVSVRLPVQRLEAMSKALQECAQVARHLRIAGTDEVCVIFDQYDLYQVWFGGIGLCLSPEDFHLFCRLVNEASQHPIVLPGYGENAIANPEGSIRTTYHLFSLN
jgi:hypothetical protein